MFIGYGDLSPRGDCGKIFTIAYSLLAVGLFASVVTQLSSAFVEPSSARLRRSA